MDYDYFRHMLPEVHVSQAHDSGTSTPPSAEILNAHRQERALRLCFLIDLATMLPVVAVALLANSMLLLTDVFDYAKSLVATTTSLLILRRIRRGHVEQYEYGSDKMEVLGSAAVSCLMLAGVILMSLLTMNRIIHPEPVHAMFTLIGSMFHAAGLGLNGWLWRRNRKLATATSGPLLEAQWRANRADALANAGVLVALVLTLSLRAFPGSLYIDPVCALVALVYPAGAFVTLLRRSLDDLLDRALDEAVQLKIMKRLADCWDGYDSFHGVRSRRAGSRSFVDLRLGFHADRSIGEVMDTVERLRTGLEADIPGVEVNVVLAKADRLFEGHAAKTPVKMVPLSPATLKPALRLIETTFDLLSSEVPVLELEESIEPGRHAAALAESGMSDPCYWVAYYHGKVVGLTGIYFKAEDRQEAVWGGWTVYDAKLREGASRAKVIMIQKVMIEARATGRRYLRLYTSTVPVEAQANRLYDKLGLKIYRTEPMDDGKNLILYRQAELSHICEVMGI
jgi:cation diffusion facilitator family transporter